MEEKTFATLKYENHFNAELDHFCDELKRLAIKEDYPFVRDLLKKTIKEFKEMDKEDEYLIP